MKTYNEIIIERLRAGCNGLQSAAADIIEEQDQEIASGKEDFQEALEISKLSLVTLRVSLDRILELEKILRWIHDNPCAHQENVKWVVKDALGLK